MFERFSDRAREVMSLAYEQVQRFNHKYIGTEHILLGLAAEGSGGGAKILKNMGLDLEGMLAEVERLVKAGPEPITHGKAPQTPRAKKVIEYAIEEARALQYKYIGTEHILVGLLRVTDGVAAQILNNLGASLDDVRSHLQDNSSS